MTDIEGVTPKSITKGTALADPLHPAELKRIGESLLNWVETLEFSS